MLVRFQWLDHEVTMMYFIGLYEVVDFSNKTVAQRSGKFRISLGLNAVSRLPSSLG